MDKTSLLSALFLVVSGCSNPYTQFYTDYTGGVNVLEDARFVVGTGEPRLIRGSTLEQDEQRMLEDGYNLIGESGFEGARVDQGLAIAQARKVHADVVIVYSQYTNTRSGSIPTTTPDKQTTYGSTTTYIPYSVDGYDYLATYWIKANLRLGLHGRGLTYEERKSLGTNKGLYVYVVVKNSPAWEADLMPGDVIRKFNGVEVIDDGHFASLLDAIDNPAVQLETSRQGQTILKEVTLAGRFPNKDDTPALQEAEGEEPSQVDSGDIIESVDLPEDGPAKK